MGGSTSAGYGINNSGQVTGQSWTSSGATHAVVGDSSGLTDLGTLGGTHSVGYGISDSGQVVGRSGASGYSVDPAFLWDSTDGMLDLNDLADDLTGWNSLTAAYGISDNGDYITGEGVTAGGDTHAFVLERIAPVPVPAAWVLLGSGLLGLVARQRRQSAAA